MSLHKCADCSTRYAAEIPACPHCGSGSTEKEDSVAERLPLFIVVSCLACHNGPWTVRLESKTSGLIELPTLACASCGSRVPVTWPPEEEPMSPKISVHHGATNAHGTDVSPAEPVSQPQVAAEGDLGRPTPAPAEAEVETDTGDVEYDSLTLAELREAATARELPSYGTKAQIIERLREDDADDKA